MENKKPCDCPREHTVQEFGEVVRLNREIDAFGEKYGPCALMAFLLAAVLENDKKHPLELKAMRASMDSKSDEN